MRVLITGSREFTDRELVREAIKQVWLENGKQPLTIVHGAARGTDSIAGEIAREAREGSLTEEPHPADWNRYGKRAGYLRNQEMVDLGADVCLAFRKEGAENKGTQMCIDIAQRAGIPIRIVQEPQ